MSLGYYHRIKKDRQRSIDELTYDDDLEMSDEELDDHIADLKEMAWIDSLEEHE